MMKEFYDIHDCFFPESWPQLNVSSLGENKRGESLKLINRQSFVFTSNSIFD